LAGADLDGAVAAGGADEPSDGPAGAVFDQAGDREGGEDDGQVRVDRLAFVVVDRPGGQVVFGYPERLLDVVEPVVGVEHELRRRVGDVRDVALEAGQGAGFGFQFAVDGLGGAGEPDEPVPFDRGLAGDGFLGLGDLFVDPARSVRRARSALYW
jgi:hypothetical protein